MRAFTASFVTLFAIGCNPVTLGDDTGTPIDETDLPDTERDLDGDGYTADEDCDDENADVHPGGDEGDSANGDDEDCNGVADDRSVCDDGLADYETIQGAVDDAPDDFVLLVCPGTYEENVVLDHDITIRSTDGADDTIIDAGGNGQAVSVTDGTGAIDGFTLTGGTGELGGNVNCSGAEVILSNSIVTGGAAVVGGGGFGAANCDYTVTDNTFSANTTEGIGGGVYVRGSDGDVNNNVIEANIALEGGGLAIEGGRGSADGNTIEGNVASTIDEDHRGAGSGGGGVWMDSSHTFTNNTVSFNESYYNGGGIILFQHAGDIAGNTIEGNNSHEDGAGIYANYSRTAFDGNLVKDNVANDDAGGLRSYVGQMVITNNTFEGNSAGDDGGGLKMSHSSNTVADNHFEGNVAGDAGGGIELDNETADIHGCTFLNNTANRGGGLHSWTNEGNLTIQDNHFEGNHANVCGGAIEMDNNPYWVTLRHLTIVNNTADDGAAICMDIWDIVPDEGEPYNYVAKGRLQNSILAGNEASDDGGAIYVKLGELEVNNVTMDDNGAQTGEIVVKVGGIVTVTNSIVNNSHVDGLGWVEDDGVLNASYNSWFDDDGFYGMDDPRGSDGNASLNPDFNADWTLGSSSECVDAGNPNGEDADGSALDLGAFGGPNGAW